MLTIVSASFNSYDYLSLNYSEVSKRCSSFQWIVADNSFNLVDDRFIVVPGIEMPSRTLSNVNKHSHQHGLGLNKLLSRINTKYVLFLDPDFYLRFNLDQLIKYCDRKGLDFFGAPYFPGRQRPVMDFPVAFCMLVNTHTIDISTFDFQPLDIVDANIWYDTGHQIYQAYRNNSKFEILTPSKGDKDAEFYIWKNEIAGIHYRMKVHLKTQSQIKNRFDKHKAFLKRYDTTIHSI